MAPAIDLTPLLSSPELPDIVNVLSKRLHDEAPLREKFYHDINDDIKAEFIEGEVVMHSPAMNRHTQTRMNLARLLGVFVHINGRGQVSDEKCLCIFPRNDYEPDIVFFGSDKAAAITSTTMKFPIPDFVVEVLSDSTEQRDRGVKFQDYDAHGVGEYWIVDPEHETVEQFVREKEGDRFNLALKSGSGEIESRVIPGFRIPIRAIFDAAENVTAMRRLMEQ